MQQPTGRARRIGALILGRSARTSSADQGGYSSYVR